VAAAAAQASASDATSRGFDAIPPEGISSNLGAKREISEPCVR